MDDERAAMDRRAFSRYISCVRHNGKLSLLFRARALCDALGLPADNYSRERCTAGGALVIDETGVANSFMMTGIDEMFFIDVVGV